MNDEYAKLAALLNKQESTGYLTAILIAKLIKFTVASYIFWLMYTWVAK